MTWWSWLIVYGAILVVGAVFLFLRTRATWRKVTALGEVLGTSSALVGDFGARSGRPDRRAEAPIRRLVVFEYPPDVRAELRATRATLTQQRAARREARRPRWARDYTRR